MRRLQFLALGLFAGGVFLYGCQSTAPRWTDVGGDTLTPAQVAQQERALAARNELAQTLMGHLQEALQSGDAASAIRVCKEIAPALATEIGAKHHVTIGRTSFRLRNVENVPPVWAVPFVEKEIDSPLFLANREDGSFAALLPIHLSSQCLQCHGPRDAISQEVQAALADAYPNDAAVGFADGDLRGWFHVEVPPLP